MPFTLNSITGKLDYYKIKGPTSSTDDAVVTWNGTGGNTVQDSVVIVDGSGNVSGVGTLALTGNLTLGSDGSGVDALFYGGTASNSLLWDASENVLDIASTMKAADNVIQVTVTDATTLSSGYGRGMYVGYTVSGSKSGSYAINGLGIDMTISEGCPTISALEVYTSAISNKTVGNLYPISIYCEDIGTNVSNFMALDIGINSTNTAASRHTGIRIRNHSGTAKAAITIEEAFTDTILRHSPSGVDLKLITLDNSSGAIFYWDASEAKFRFNKGIYVDGTITFGGSIVLPADGSIGVSDGNPKIVFDNANNWMEISGYVGIGITTPRGVLQVELLNNGAESLPLIVSNDGASNGTAAGIDFRPVQNTSSTKGKIVSTRNSGNDYDLKFYTFNSDGLFEALELDLNGTGTFGGNIVIQDDGNIGSASDTDAIAIASGGEVTLSQTLVLSDVVDAATDTDKFLVLDGSDNVDYRTGAEVLSDIGATGVAFAIAAVLGTL